MRFCDLVEGYNESIHGRNWLHTGRAVKDKLGLAKTFFKNGNKMIVRYARFPTLLEIKIPIYNLCLLSLGVT